MAVFQPSDESSTYSERFQNRKAVQSYECEEYAAESYSTYIWKLQRPLLMHLVQRFCPQPSTAQVLDFACGTGRITQLLEETGCQPDGLDISSDMIDSARQKCSQTTFYTANVLEDDQVCVGPYDLITAFRLLLNLDPGLRVPILMQIRKRVSENATLLINVHGNAKSARHPAIAWKRRKKAGSAGLMLNEMTMDEAKDCLLQAGFEVVEVYGFGVLPPTLFKLPGASLFRIFDQWLSRFRLLKGICIDLVFVCRPVSLLKHLPARMKNDWLELLAASSIGVGEPRRFRVIKKRGENILFLPTKNAAARKTLQLYPAQTSFAQTMLRLAGTITDLGFPLSFTQIEVLLDQKRPFASFLSSVAGEKTIPLFGVLSGNVREVGRRFVLLIFDDECQAKMVIKIGLTHEAKRLIALEQHFIETHREKYRIFPKPIASYVDSDVSALALEYIPGSSPREVDNKKIFGVLQSWIHQGDLVEIQALTHWPNIATVWKHLPSVVKVLERLRHAKVRPVLYHGDFAPWNIRVVEDSGVWMVLDWERGCEQGFPGWDWFHFIIQQSTLVQKASAADTVSDLKQLIQSPEFISYATMTEISEIIWDLIIVQVVHSLNFVSQVDRRGALQSLLREIEKEHYSDPSTETASSISVVTPSYKQLRWLQLCTASVNDQVGIEVEHIIQDAKSGDNLERWVRENTNSKIFIESDSGMYDAINRGFLRATGDIVGWLNCDEQYLPGALAQVADFFRNNPDVEVIFGDAILLDELGNLLSYRKAILPSLSHTRSSHLNVLSCATFIRRRILDRGLYLKPEWKAIADAVWVADMLEAGVKMAILSKPLATFTITDSNLGQSSLAHTETRRWRESSKEGGALRVLVIIVWHRFRKFLAGAYRSREVDTAIYTQQSPLERVKVFSSALTFRWVRAGQMHSASGPQQMLQKSNHLSIRWWCWILAIVCPSLIGLIDHFMSGVVIAPFLGILTLLSLSFFLRAREVGLVALGIVCAVAISLQGQSIPNILIRMVSFALASSLVIFIVNYRNTLQRNSEQVMTLLQKIPTPLVLSDAAGFITFVNDEAATYLEQSSHSWTGRRYVHCFMADLVEGEGMRRYIEMFGVTTGYRGDVTLFLERDNQKQVPARLLCFGEGEQRFLITVFT